MSMRIRPMSDLLAAEVSGLDLRTALHPSEIDALRHAWAKYRVLVFRDQALDDAGHARFASHFGVVCDFGGRPHAAGESRNVYRSSNTDEAGQLIPADDERSRQLTINWLWHTDGCYRSMPNRGVVLRALEVPAVGGDTVFANMEAAYGALPEGTRQRADRLVCCHDFARMIARCGMQASAPHGAGSPPPVWHPLVWQHAAGRRSLFLSPPYMERIDGLGIPEAQAFISELAEWASRDRFLYRHRWRAHDVLMWDNHWTMHKVTPYDLARHKRVMRGATLQGSDPVAPVAHG